MNQKGNSTLITGLSGGVSPVNDRLGKKPPMKCAAFVRLYSWLFNNNGILISEPIQLN